MIRRALSKAGLSKAGLSKAGLSKGGPSDVDDHGVIGVKLPPAAIIEHPEGHVAALLNFRDHEAGTDRMDSAGRKENGSTRLKFPPAHQTRDRPIVD